MRYTNPRLLRLTFSPLARLSDAFFKCDRILAILFVFSDFCHTVRAAFVLLNK